MKSYILLIVFLLSALMVHSQTEFDALKLVETDIYGTARYMSMGGAFGALGGDPSAIKDNPAALGIYRKSELTGTLNTLMQQTVAEWNDETSTDDLYKMNLNNLSLALTFPTWRNENGYTGLLSSNWSFSYNRLKSFNRRLNIRSGATNSSMTDYMAMFTSAYRSYFDGGLKNSDLHYTDSYEPFDQQAIPWLSILAYEGYLINESGGENSGQWSSLLNNNETVTPSFSLQESGHTDEYSIGWSGNFSNKLFIGTTLNFQSMDYSARSIYSESFGNGGGMKLTNVFSTSGTGVNFNLGAILVPMNSIRLGFALHTPTIYTLTDYTNGNLEYNTEDISSIATPTDGYANYKIQSPLQYNLSAAYLFGKKGLLSIEYVKNNYQSTRFMDTENSTQYFENENEGMRDMLNNSRTIKIGGEFKLNQNLALRAGFANVSSPTQSTASKLMADNTIRTDTEYFLRKRTDYFSLGLGYMESNWHIDFAIQAKNQEDSFYPYNSSNLDASLMGNAATVYTYNTNAVVTLGVKF